MRRGNTAVASLQQAPDSESEKDLEWKHWKVQSIVGANGKGPQRYFQLLWAATTDAGEVKIWEPEAQLLEDGCGPVIELFEAAQVAVWQRPGEPRPPRGEQHQATVLMQWRSKEAARHWGSAAGCSRSWTTRCYCEAWWPLKGCRRIFTGLDGWVLI